MPELNIDDATALAGSLANIGHPRMQAAINATAFCLVKWCKGAIIDGLVYSPERQAQELVQRACETWTEGWPVRGGTAKLLALFRELYEARKPVVENPATQEQLIARGVLSPPCEVCNDTLHIGAPPHMMYCTACAQGRHNARWHGPEQLALLNAAPEPAPIKRHHDREEWPPMVPGIDEQREKAWRESQAANQRAVDAAKATIENPHATSDQKDAAMQVLLLFSSRGSRAPKKTKAERERLGQIFKKWGVD
jgi:hypothetical protein